ncbi:MAG: cadherin-like domain-containing protein [Chloroflexota bacterium]|nr:cadherin-like domain-containing protein [Chloroflexota bacterium]
MIYAFIRSQVNHYSRFAITMIIVMLILVSTIIISSLVHLSPVSANGIDSAIGSDLEEPSSSSMDVSVESSVGPEQETWVDMIPSKVEQWITGTWVDPTTGIDIADKSGMVLLYDGTSLEQLNSRTSRHLQFIWGHSYQDIFIVGQYGNIFYYDGSAWSFIENGAPSELCDLLDCLESPMAIPSRSLQGESLDVTIAAIRDYCEFAVGDRNYILLYLDHMPSDFTGATAIDFGRGITVNGFSVDSNSQIKASITIDDDALIGSRDVSFLTPKGTEILPDAFTVDFNNQVPIFRDHTVSIDEGTSVGIILTGVDVEGDPLSYSVVSSPEHGKLSIEESTLYYTPDEGYNGLDRFTFKANDGKADSNIATVALTVNPVNDSPIAEDQTIITEEDTLVDIILTGSDFDGDLLSYSVVISPEHGLLSGEAPNLTYIPNQQYHGMDSITFEVSDGIASDSGKVTIEVSELSSHVVTCNEQYSITTPEGNITVEFPVGSVSGGSAAVITETELLDISKAPAGFRFGKTCFVVEYGEELMADATVIVKYSYEDVMTAGGEPHLLALARYERSVDEWIVLTTAVDTSLGTLTTNTNTFSTWTVVARDPFQGFTASSSRDMSDWIWLKWILIVVAVVVSIFILIHLIRNRAPKHPVES